MRSNRLSIEDVRSAFRLLGEIREQGDDTVAWVRHMLGGLGRLTGASVGFAGVLVAGAGPPPRSVGLADVGWACASQRTAYFRHKARREPKPDPFKHYSYLRYQTVVTVESRCLVRRLPRPLHWEEMGLARQADLGPFVYSSSPLPGAAGSFGVTLARPSAARPFNRREQRILHLFHEELAGLWRQKPGPGAVVGTWPRLPSRLRQTLELLRRGLGEKQVASALGLSCHTVHDYVKSLHERFRVSSRGELLAASAARWPHPRPWIDPALIGLPSK